MKLQIDTENFQIGISERVNLGELFDLLNRFFPGESWKKFNFVHYLDLREHVKDYPIIINPTYPYPWWQQPIVAYDTSCGTIVHDDLAHMSTTEPPSLISGIYKVEIK